MVKKIKSWKDLCVKSDVTVLKTIEVIDGGGLQIALVIDDGGRLLGTVTDGDIRRAILKGRPLSEAVKSVMNQNPVVASPTVSSESLMALFKENALRQIPIVDDSGILKGVSVLRDLIQKESRPNWVVLMAGGKGQRLYPLTKETPKPMLRIGTKPILEGILENFVSQGFSRFFLSVNYFAETVKEYFGDGSKFGVQIEYLHEPYQMGTAGSLSLLRQMPEAPSAPVLVMNGDILTKVNFRNLLDFHGEQEADATMSVREYEFQVPYGVVSLDASTPKVLSLDEKPTHKFFINGGIYVLNPRVLSLIPETGIFDMTHLFQRLLDDGKRVSAYPLREYWMDIGRLDDFERLNQAHSQELGLQKE